MNNSTKFDRKQYEELLAKATNTLMEKRIEDDNRAKECIEKIVLEEAKDLPIDNIIFLINRIFGRLRGDIGSLSYLSDFNVNEIMVNGFDTIFIEVDSHIEKVDDCFDSTEELEHVIRRIAASVHREINEFKPILDARLEDGSRVNAVMKNIAIGGPSLSIRKFGNNKISLDEMVNGGGLSAECADDIRTMVRGGLNIFVSGGTSSGKTTLLNAISDYIPESERVIVIEDSLELKLNDIANIVRLECRNANSAGKGAINMADLIRSSLRMRPDRIVVGEVRGGEVLDMLQALNTGHCGFSTGHGNSSCGMLRRIEAMYLSAVEIPVDAIRMQICEAIDILIHMERLPSGRRKIIEVNELTGYRDGEYVLNPLYELSDDMSLVRTDNLLSDDIKLRLRGINDTGLQRVQAKQ